jgi:hypothetical protein
MNSQRTGTVIARTRSAQKMKLPLRHLKVSAMLEVMMNSFRL